jgi:Tfp pilus assembly protein PilN
MAVQFNLLPDVKLEFDRQQRTKRLVYAISGLAIAISLALVIISFVSVNILQKKLLSDANGNITSYSNKLKSIPNLDKVLTIQNQLNALPGLHQQKHVASRLFDYLPQVTPTSVHIGKLTIDTTANTLELSGTADTVESVNKFVDTLKFTNFTVGQNNSSAKAAFLNVILTKVDRNEKGASYTIDTNFDPALFDTTQNVALVVPQETTTRSVLDAPSADNTLFNGQTGNKQNSGQGTQ